MTDPVTPAGVNQAEYLQLFMKELTYQDPLKPVDNREFMAQMAQFSSLQEARTTNEHLVRLLGMTSGNQSLNLLSKKVTLDNINGVGEVKKIMFSAKEPPKIVVHMPTGENHTVELGQITEVNI